MIGVANTSPETRADATCPPQRKGRTCPECLCVYAATGSRQIFCSDGHKAEWEARGRLRGRQVLPFSTAARQTRDGTRGSQDMREVGKKAARIARTLYQRWKDDDAAAGRMNAIDYAALRIRLGYDLP